MTANNKIKILAVVGSTASGKTALSIALAKALGGEVISCDSMQPYRRMDIGTAKPTREEMDGVAHHLLDCIEPDTPFSCADYVRMAREVIEEVCARGKLPILCGGTGLYLDGVLRGGAFEETETDPELRRALLAYAEQNGNAALHQRLAAIDPESAAAIHENNVKRVARAIEIFETTGITKTEADRRSVCFESPYHACVIGLRYQSRDLLYRRIDARVDAMMCQGLLEETRTLLQEGLFARNATAAQAIGYKELLGYLDGKESLESALETLKRATRRYAKRQLTWFSAKSYVQWINADTEEGQRPFRALLREAIALSAQTLGLSETDALQKGGLL